jgi:hypothetical protein
MSDLVIAASALAQVAVGELEDAATTLNVLPHDRAIAALLRVGSTTARFAAQETGIPVGVLLTTIGAAR